MASSTFVVVSSLLAFVLSLLFSNGVVPMHASFTNGVPFTICKKTRNPSLCFNVLKSAGTTNLKRLATYTLDLANNKAAQSHALAQSLASKSADPKLKERYAICAEHYNNVVVVIEGAKSNLGKGDYNGVNIQASRAITEASDCLDNFTQPPKDPSTLSGNGKAVEDICNIVLVIANLLLGRA
ncbi:pectinesterase inhibitor-like [Cucurbita pepo subsp. pepo]|uniref:pectinesterase inhibitor-like n=1 Tax=Cucurbita pepo subsp. pepo TaxID=3664 RepID=UPI000C9DA3E5|nr:pectinesterase inhibitor-like [Cucurbita pepo subsp. pepo]